ncbi:MAG: metal-dependent transcriptional regulator [Clostridiales bacterium]|nr:metal-dependent transcriptional regulator [Clostridiales bacterium]
MPEPIESRENYLETVFMLSKKGPVRATDVAEMSGYSKPSVSVAVHSLENAGYIEIDENKFIHLTPKGEKIAMEVYARHKYITAFLTRALELAEDTAEADACKIEHFISTEMYEAIQKYVDEKR